MLRNPKKSIHIRNRTNYFDPSCCRTNIVVSSPFSYNFRQQKIEGYETRLYYQFLWCRDNNGQTFFYTLTYNDKSIPKYYGTNCFDYEDLRDLLTGGLRKILLRKYGTRFKYFIGAELGDGKGSRGFHNNPHYHILFFLEPANDPRYPYKKISPLEFRHLIRNYWQGFDESTDGWKSYGQAKYGIAREGDNYGLVSDFRACMYVAKYVSKDSALKAKENSIRSNLWKRLDERFKNDNTFWSDFFKHLREQFPDSLELSDHDFILSRFPSSPAIPESIGYKPYCDMFLSRFHLWDLLLKYKVQTYEPYIQEEILLYRNRYCNKARISQGTGLYALEFIKNPEDPRIPIPSKNGFKNRPLCLYYYRKLFCDVVKDPNTGNNIYILNAKGQEFKLSRLSYSLNRLSQQAQNNLELLRDCPTLFDLILKSDVNDSFKMKYPIFSKTLAEVDLSIVSKRYAEYKFIYSGRYYLISDSSSIPDAFQDYKRFLVPTYSPESYDPEGLNSFLNSHSDYRSYDQHPYFSPYRRLFALLDLCADYLFVQEDNRNQKKAEEIQEVKRFHTVNELSVRYAAPKVIPIKSSSVSIVFN